MTERATTFDLVISAAASPDADLSCRNRRILVDAYAAVLNGDEDAVFNCCAPDVVFIEPESLPCGCEKRGVEGAKAGVAAAFGTWTDLRCDIEEFVATGDIVIAYMHVIFTARATGEVYRGPTAEMFRLREGRIVEWRVIYWDAHRVRQVCGIT